MQLQTATVICFFLKLLLSIPQKVQTTTYQKLSNIHTEVVAQNLLAPLLNLLRQP